MTVLKPAIKLVVIAMVLLGLNGLINLSLLIPLHGPSTMNQLRLHLDDGAWHRHGYRCGLFVDEPPWFAGDDGTHSYAGRGRQGHLNAWIGCDD